MASLEDLISCAEITRKAFEPGLARDGTDCATSAGSCLHAAVLLVEILHRFALAKACVRGGNGALGLGAMDVQGRWQGHYWVEAVLDGQRQFVVDITADQFGYPPVRVLAAAEALGYLPGDESEVSLAATRLKPDLGLS